MRALRGHFDDGTDKISMYANGFYEDTVMGVQVYFGFNDSNLLRNISVDFVGKRSIASRT